MCALVVGLWDLDLWINPMAGELSSVDKRHSSYPRSLSMMPIHTPMSSAKNSRSLDGLSCEILFGFAISRRYYWS